jgi:hypothetical protein
LFWGKNEAWFKCIYARGAGDITKSNQVWSYTLDKHVLATPALHEELLYLADCGRKFYCFDARTGKPLWEYAYDKYWYVPLFGLNWVHGASAKLQWTPRIDTPQFARLVHGPGEGGAELPMGGAVRHDPCAERTGVVERDFEVGASCPRMIPIRSCWRSRCSRRKSTPSDSRACPSLEPGTDPSPGELRSNPRGGRRTPPYAFTEHGVAMLSSVLKSGRAVQMSILIIRAFVKMRELLASHKDLAARVEKLETSQKRHASVINILAEEIEDLKRPSAEPPKRRIGFRPPGS